MAASKVLCLALVIMTMAPSFGGLLKDAMVVEALKAAAGKHAEVTTTDVANPSNPPNPPAAADAKALLLGASVDVNIKKVPVVTMTDAPCKNICKNVCKVDMTKSCKKVPVISKECTPTMKTLTKQVCSKKCALTVETPKVLKAITVHTDTPSNPNPSTPPALAADTIATAAGSAEVQLPSLTLEKQVDVDISATGIGADLSVGKGRRLSGIAVHATKAALTAKLIKSLPVPACSEVCDDVHFEMPDLDCHEVTREVESCKLVPSKNCQQECVCVPQKTFAVNLPKKTLDVSISKP